MCNTPSNFALSVLLAKQVSGVVFHWFYKVLGFRAPPGRVPGRVRLQGSFWDLFGSFWGLILRAFFNAMMNINCDIFLQVPGTYRNYISLPPDFRKTANVKLHFLSALHQKEKERERDDGKRALIARDVW